MTGAIDIKLP